MRRLVTGTIVLSLTACTVGPDFSAPAPPPPEAGYASDTAGNAMLGEGPSAEWWTAFGSNELDALVAQAIERNASLAASRATLERARAQVVAVAGKRLPQANASARADYEQVNLSAIGIGDKLGAAGIGNPEFDLYTVGGGISYDLDLFGRNRRALEQAAAQAEAQQHETAAAHLVIAGQVVIQVLAIAAINDRIATERALLSEGERNVALTETKHRAGDGTLVEVLSAQGQLAADRALLPVLEQQQAQERAMLAILLGLSPAELGATAFSLNRFSLPGPVPVAMPSTMVRKRPDILAAEARLHAATAAIGVATADLYPDVTLGASLTQSTSTPEKIFESRFNAFDLFAGLAAPLFDGGTRKARKRGAEADARAAAATWRQTVLEAFGQVSGLLSALDTNSRALAAQREAVSIAGRSLDLSRRSFQAGNSGILQVLDSSRAYQRAQLALLDARARQYIDIARLHVATAGGWISDPPASEARPAKGY